jgi:hypothetical protein
MCHKCICFIQDFLEYPSHTYKLSSSKKLSSLTRTIAHEIHRLLISFNSHHNMVKRVKREYLNLVEKNIHTPCKPLELHLWNVALNYYKYTYPSYKREQELDQTVQLITVELVESGCFRSQKDASLWLLEKYFFLLECLKEIHDEHSGVKPADLTTLVFNKHEKITDEEIESWGNLYD